jgi:hypothetical protein
MLQRSAAQFRDLSRFEEPQDRADRVRHHVYTGKPFHDPERPCPGVVLGTWSSGLLSKKPTARIARNRRGKIGPSMRALAEIYRSPRTWIRFACPMTRSAFEDQLSSPWRLPVDKTIGERNRRHSPMLFNLPVFSIAAYIKLRSVCRRAC